MLADQEKPVAAPGDITHHRAMPWYLDGDGLTVTVGRHIAHADREVCMQGGLDDAHWGFDLVQARFDPAHMVQ
ncbi:hypothetical protein D3C80_2084690 [compost metagenome]